MELSTPEARHVSGPDTPLNAGERAALRSFRRAALTSRGYRAHLERLGVDHRTVTRLSQVPFTDKRSVFGDHIDFWLDGGRVAEAAELLTSSGQTGLFSVGVTSRSERRAQERTLRPDPAGRSAAARTARRCSSTACRWGSRIPTRLATVATPRCTWRWRSSCWPGPAELRPRGHRGRAALPEGDGRDGPARARAPASPTSVVACFVGGEWVAESWRRYVSRALRLPRRRRARASG